MRRDGGGRSERVRLRRVFFALWPDEGFCARLSAEVAPLLERLQGRSELRDDWHVTLCFVGSVDEGALAILQAGAEALMTARFALQLDRLEYWPEARAVAVTASQVPPAALELAGALRRLMPAVGMTAEDRPLRPHLTLMRGVSSYAWGVVHAERVQMLEVALDFSAGAFDLAASLPGAPTAHAGRYTRLASWPLAVCSAGCGRGASAS